jgi:photosystem II stability/assembly factor-like uncharacterized protein
MNLLRIVRAGTTVACAILVLSAPSGARDALFGVASRGTSAVAVGDSGRILYAPEAPHNTVWNAATLNATKPLRAVTVGANDYVAVGDGGSLYRSGGAVGNSWTPRSSHTPHDLFGVTDLPSALVAVGDSGTVIRSASLEADDWTSITVPTSKRLRAVVGGSLRTVAVGDSGTVIWAASTNPGAWFVASAVPTTEDLLGVAEGPGNPNTRFWAVGKSGTLIRSLPNAEQWEALSSTVGVDLHAVTFQPPAYTIGVAVGDGGTILFSNGGATWTQVDSHTTANLYGVGYTGSGTGGGFVAVGDSNVILWSGDGMTWVDVIVATKSQTWGSIRGSWASERPAR